MQFKFYWPLWLLIILLLFSAGGTIGAYLALSTPRVSRITKAGLIGLRLLAILVLIFCLTQPIRIGQESINPVSNLLVLIDTTSSMGLVDVQEKNTNRLRSRLEVVRKWLFENDLGRTFSARSDLYGRIEPQFYQFWDDQITKIVPDSGTNSFLPKGYETDFQASINQAALEWRGQPLSGIILISDGGHNVGAIDFEEIRQLQTPIYTLGVGNENQPSDVQIKKIQVSPIVYVGQKAPIRATVYQRGFSRQKTEISLRNESNSISSKTITFADETTTLDQTIDFEIEPKAEGSLTYTIQLPVLEGEATAENNQKSVTIRAVKSKLMVLLVDGYPRWEYTFLKRTLKKNVDTEVKGMILKNSPPFPTNSDIKSIEAFPTKIEDLLKYDIVVLGDLSSNQLSIDQKRILVDYVQQFGRSVVFLSGAVSLGNKGLLNSELADILPILAPKGCLFSETEVDLKLTPLGQQHSSMQLSLDFDQNQKNWHNLPALSGWFRNFELKSSAIVLAEHESESIPILTYFQSGLGKSLLLSAEGSWRWTFESPLQKSMVDQISSGSHYSRFWLQTIRWLSSRVSNNPIHVTSDRINYQIGETIELIVYAYDANFMPMTQAEIKLNVIPSDNLSFQLSADEIGTGVYRSTFTANTTGRYIIQASASNSEDEIEIQVNSNTSEFDRPYLDKELMSTLASGTGGIYHQIDNVSAEELADLISAPSKPVYQTVEHQLWDHPLIFLFVLTLLGGEWLWRKRCGLI